MLDEEGLGKRPKHERTFAAGSRYADQSHLGGPAADQPLDVRDARAVADHGFDPRAGRGREQIVGDRGAGIGLGAHTDASVV
jgi:hypothetical protein